MSLCVDCNLKFQQAEQLKHNRLVDMMNYYAAQAEIATGGFISVPRIPVRSLFGGDVLTLTNIHLDKSTVGAINMGNIHQLDIAISQMSGRGEAGLAEAIKELTDAAIKSQEIAEDTKNEILEQLSFLATEATKPKERRSLTVAKSVLGTLTNIISAASGLSDLWEKAEPLLRTALGG